MLEHKFTIHLSTEIPSMINSPSLPNTKKLHFSLRIKNLQVFLDQWFSLHTDFLGMFLLPECPLLLSKNQILAQITKRKREREDKNYQY